MRSSLRLLLLLTPLLFASCDREARNEAPEHPPVRVERIAYAGWEGAWKLSSAHLEAVVVPQIGRVMQCSKPGGPNLLWQDPSLHGKTLSGEPKDWMNFGGDKVWPAEQKQWPKLVGRGWPPDTAFDGMPCAAEAIPGGVRIAGPVSKPLGARYVREITLLPGRAALRVRQWIEKTTGEPKPLTLWNVTQIAQPEFAFMPAGAKEEIHELIGVKDHSEFEFDAAARAVTIRDHEKKSMKIGVRGAESWAAAKVGTALFVESRRLEPDAAYPDGGCHAEIYTAPRPTGYTELELLSPMRELKAGETLRSDMVWTLLDVPAGAKLDALAKTAREAHAQALKEWGD
ncbi:MAG: DUF4380 domain-containing protein [Planctomycetota bacterium]|nr:DUF4380 domain-containing protein [Planctomycetota bacterium]